MIKRADRSNISFIIDLLKSTNVQTFKKDALENMLNSDIYNIFIYFDNKIPLGLIITWHSDIYGQIIDFAVNKAKQNQGIGKKLLKYAILFLINKGVCEISLEVRKSNKNAIHIYEKFKFKYEKAIPNYYKNEDGLLYRWKNDSISSRNKLR